MKNLALEHVARVCHEANRAYCESIGDHSQRVWDEAEQWQRESAIRGVAYAIANPNAPVSAQHDAWLADKERDGWKFGLVKDAAKKEHPCCVPYSELPAEQKFKDALFKTIVACFVTSPDVNLTQVAA